MMSKAAPLLALAAIILFSGCSFNKVQIHPSYRPTLQRMEGTQNRSVATTVHFDPVFADDPTVVGVKKNVRGWETARVHLSENVEVWVKNAFDEELRAAGFHTNSDPNKSDLHITLNVKQLFVEPWIGLWTCDLIGIMNIEVVLEPSGRASCYARRFVSYDRTTWPRSVFRLLSLGSGFFEARMLNVAKRSIPEIIKEIQRLVTENIESTANHRLSAS